MLLITFEFERQMKVYKDLINNGEKYEQNYRWEQAYNIYLNAEKIVKKYGSKNEIGNIYYRKGRVLAWKGNLKEALIAFKESLKFLKKGGGTQLQIAEVKGAIGDAYKISGIMNDALEAYQDTLKILRAEKERVVYTHSHLTSQILEAIAKQLNNVGEVYLSLNNWDKALENSRESLKVALDTKTTSIILKAKLAISRIYSEKGDKVTSLEYLMKSIEIAKKEKDEGNLLNIFLEVGNIYKNEDNSKLALNFYRKGLKLAEKLENKQKITIILDKIGDIYLSKKNKKKALEFLERSYAAGNEIKQYYFEYILYHMGVLHYLNKNYDDAYENFQESLRYAKKTNNKRLHINCLIRIGNIWKVKENFDDSIYYHKKALELIRNKERKIEILNKIGVSNLLSNNLMGANDCFLESFNELRILILTEPNFDKKKQLIKKFSSILQNLSTLKCSLYEKSKNTEMLKEAIGFSEFLKSQTMPNKLKSNFGPIECPALKNNQDKINEKCLELKKLSEKYQLEQNNKAKEKLLDQMVYTQKEIFQLEEVIWESCDVPVESFPQSVQKFIDRLFQVTTSISELPAILDFVYVKSLNLSHIFVIDIKKKELNLFSKQLNVRTINTIKNNLKQLQDPKIKENQIKFNKLKASLNNSWGKIVPKSLTSFIIKQNYDSLYIISHSFFNQLSWEKMLLKKQKLKNLFNLHGIYSLYYIILKKTV